jgi:hypothetical protein
MTIPQNKRNVNQRLLFMLRLFVDFAANRLGGFYF